MRSASFCTSVAEIDLHGSRQRDAEIALHHISDATFARLAVDANDGLVGATQILRVDGQVRHLPIGAVCRLLGIQPLAYGVLMRARKGGEDEIAGIGVPRMHGQLIAVLGHLAHAVDVGKIELGIDALRIEVQGQGHEIHVARAFAVAKQRTFDALGPGHDAQFCGGDAAAAVVVGVQRQLDGVAALQIAVHPFDLVGINVRRRELDRRRQVDDHRPLRRRLEDIRDSVADLLCEIELRAGEALRRILPDQLGVSDLITQTAHQLGTAHGQVDDPGAVHIEDQLALCHRRRVVEMHDGALGAGDGFEGALDQMLARLGQHLNGDVIRNQPTLDQLAGEVEVGSATRRGSRPRFP